MNDLGIDIRFGLKKFLDRRRPEMRLTDEDRAVMGPLAEAEIDSDSPEAVLQGVYDCIRTKLQGDLTSPNPVIVVRALAAMRRAFQNLVHCGGYEEFSPFLKGLESGLDSVAQAARRLLERRLDDPLTSAEDAELIREFLAGESIARECGR
jgi:hypothetical protein